MPSAVLRGARGAAALALLAGPLASQAEVEPSWFRGELAGALSLAGERPAKLLFVYAWNDATDPALYTQTLKTKAVVDALADFVCYSADAADPAGRAVFERYGIQKGPALLLLRPDGEVEDALAGFFSPADLIAELKRIRAGEKTLRVLRAAAAAKPDDLAMQLELAHKLRAAGDAAGYQKTLAAIKAADPKAKTETGAMVVLQEILDETFAPAVTPERVDLKPLQDFLVKQRNKRVLFLGWDRVAGAEHRRGKLKEAAAAVKRAWKACPEDQVMDWGNRIAAHAWTNRKELSQGDLKLALEIAKRAAAKAEEANQATIPDYPKFLAWRLYTLAAAYYMNSKRKEAIATMERAVTLLPDKDLRAVLEGFKSGNIVN